MPFSTAADGNRPRPRLAQPWCPPLERRFRTRTATVPSWRYSGSRAPSAVPASTAVARPHARLARRAFVYLGPADGGGALAGGAGARIHGERLHARVAQPITQ